MSSWFGGIVQVPTVTLSDLSPTTETITPVAGALPNASRGDHAHPRLTSAGVYTLNGSGEATITFTRLFQVVPAVVCLLVENADNQPVIFKVKSWVQTGSDYTGCIIKGYRSQAVPQNLATLLLGAVYNIFGGNASGAQFCCVALMPSA